MEMNDERKKKGVKVSVSNFYFYVNESHKKA